MKALTICQPYAHLIALPDSDPYCKRVENRTWRVWAGRHTEPLLIHAGKSREWLCGGLDTDHRGNPMVFGAFVAGCNLVDCVHISDLDGWIKAHPGYGWLKQKHGCRDVFGPYLWILSDVFRIDPPVFARGRQGLWDAPREAVLAATEAMLENEAAALGYE